MCSSCTGRFVPGLVAFLLAHLAYLGAFLLTGGDAAWLVAGLAIALAVVGTVGRALVRAARAAGLGGPVTLYLGAITVMAVAATRTGEPAAIAGAWLFSGRRPTRCSGGAGCGRRGSAACHAGGGRGLRRGSGRLLAFAAVLILLALAS